MLLWKHLTSLVGRILRSVSQVSRGVQSRATGASESASSSNKSAFGNVLTGIRTPPQKVPLLIIYGCGKLRNRTSIIENFKKIAVPLYVGM